MGRSYFDGGLFQLIGYQIFLRIFDINDKRLYYKKLQACASSFTKRQAISFKSML